MNMPKPKNREEMKAEAKDDYAKIFAFAVETLEALCKAKGGVFAKTAVSAIWYKDGSFERIMYDPALAVGDQLPLCPTAESYAEGSEQGFTMGLMFLEDVTDYWGN